MLLLLIAALSVAGLVAYQIWGLDGVASAFVAATVCGAPALVTLIARGLFVGPQGLVAGTVLSIMLRTGVPLSVLGVLIITGNRLIEAGIVPLVMAFYLVSVAIETVFAVRFCQAPIAGK